MPTTKKTTERIPFNRAALYDEDEIIAAWRDAADLQHGEQRERLTRLADQLQQIVWLRGSFAPDKPKLVKLTIRGDDA